MINNGNNARPSVNQEESRKRTWHLVDFAMSADHKMILKESEKIYKYLDLAREQEHEGDSDTNCSWCP